jgi:hypothetical protein
VFLSGAISNGVVGNAAYDALRLGAMNVRYRLAHGRREDQAMFVRQVAELKVRVRLRIGTLTRCDLSQVRVLPPGYLARPGWPTHSTNAPGRT